MGQDQSTEQHRPRPTVAPHRSRQAEHQQQTPPPYTVFSMDRSEQRRFQHQHQQHQQQQQQQQQQRRGRQRSGTTPASADKQFTILDEQQQRRQQEDDGVVDVVVKAKDRLSSVTAPSARQKQKSVSSASSTVAPPAATLQQEVDEIMDQLAQLPQFYPLIKSSVDQSLLKDLLQSSRLLGGGKGRYSSVQELDSLDSRSLVEMLAEFQTHAMHQCRDVCVGQDEVVKRIRQCQLKTNECVMELNRKADRMAKLASALRDADRLVRYVDQSRLAVDSIVEQLQSLENLLPANVINNLQTPLFNVEKLLSTPRIPSSQTVSRDVANGPAASGDGVRSMVATNEDKTAHETNSLSTDGKVEDAATRTIKGTDPTKDSEPNKT